MKKRLLLLECFFIILTLITITKTYGLFETNSQATSDIPIAKWVIKVDGKDLTLAKELNYSDFIITNNICHITNHSHFSTILICHNLSFISKILII